MTHPWTSDNGTGNWVQGTAHLGGWALALIDRMHVGLLSLADDRRVLFANSEAIRVLSAGDTLTLKEGRLVAADGYQRQLDRLINGRDIGLACVVLAGSGENKLVLLLELDGPASELGGRYTLWLIDSQPGASKADWLSEAFGLTGAEVKVVDCLANGHSTEETAELLGISIATVRTHLQRTYAKTGARNQGGLVRLALLKAIR